MTAIKKTTTKSKSPAPATKAAVAPKPAKTAKTNPKKVALTPAEATAGLAALAAKAVVSQSAVTTTISARIDVGFGNALYLRGEGSGLSWEKGLAMTCLAGDLWQATLTESVQPVAFKFLINDSVWSAGPDFTVAPGQAATFTPTF